MATYLELKAQAEKLLAEAEALRQQELNTAINEIKARIAELGLSAADLGFAAAPKGSRGTPGRATSVRAAPAVKYRGPNGETWSGGRGRKPGWIVELLAAGKNIEDYAV